MRVNRIFTRSAVAFTLFIICSASYAEIPPGLSAVMSDCDAGMTKECLNAGVAFTRGDFKGKKIDKDKAKAKRYIDKALKSGERNCKQGDSLDCYTIGLLYFEGGGLVPTDIPRGLDFLRSSCRAGHKPACTWLDNSGLQM
jgi:TPR repeat protein